MDLDVGLVGRSGPYYTVRTPTPLIGVFVACLVAKLDVFASALFGEMFS